MADWQNGDVALTDPEQLGAWDELYPDANYALCAFAEPDGFVFLEFDQGSLTELAKLYGQELPRTRVHISGNGGKHFIFRHTPESIALGNRQASRNDHEWFSLRADRKYLVGPGSIHPNGNEYKVYPGYDIEPSPIPAWLVKAIDELTESQAKSPEGAVSVHEDFDFEAWCDHYDFSFIGVKDEYWHVLEECPGVGYKHQSSPTAIYYDGDTLGFHCFAGGCPLCDMSIGKVMKWMHENGHEPYKGIIWSDPNDTDFSVFAIEEALEVSGEETTPVVAMVSPNNTPPNLTFDELVEQHAKELNPDPLPVPENIAAIVNAPQAEGLAFDERAMYGRFGEIVRGIGLPLGWAFPAALGVASAFDIKDAGHTVRSNMYVALIAPPGQAKTAVTEAVEKAFLLPIDTVTYTTPGSDRGLAKIIGTDDKTVLLMEDELKSVLRKCQVPNSTLAQMMNKLWNKNQAGVADKKGRDDCSGKFSIVGNLACDDSADFALSFGSSTVSGLYSRFLLAYDTVPVKFRPREYKTPFYLSEATVRIPVWVWDAKELWEEGKPYRMGEHALRVALVMSGVNGDKEVTAECLSAAFRFMEWQMRLRIKFKPGLAETKEAECYEAVASALREQRDYQKKTGLFPKGADDVGVNQADAWMLINFTDVVKAKQLYSKYASMVTRAKVTMIEDGIIEQYMEIEYKDDGMTVKKKTKTPFYVLKKNL